MLTARIIFKLTEMLERPHWRPPKGLRQTLLLLFFVLRMYIFYALAEYSYFSTNFRLEMFCAHSEITE